MAPRRLCWLLAAAVVVSGCGGSSAAVSPTPTVGPRVGDVAPTLAGTSLRGHAVAMSAWRGSVVVVVFWASWCVPCRQEQPSLNTLARQQAALGVHFLGVSVDADSSAANGYIAQFGVPYDSLIDGSQSIVSQYEVLGPPTTFVIGRNGRVADQLLGEINIDELRSDIHIAQSTT
jgi:cytochrome c biogenesis protein CcmG/thiol:disulfide interchange protein DsbE